MAPSVPVPSKSALRALRQLALGTSCTVAFGAGLVVEDRRRRIHSATEVADHGRQLKSSIYYHKSSTVAAIFNAHLENHNQEQQQIGRTAGTVYPYEGDTSDVIAGYKALGSASYMSPSDESIDDAVASNRHDHRHTRTLGNDYAARATVVPVVQRWNPSLPEVTGPPQTLPEFRQRPEYIQQQLATAMLETLKSKDGKSHRTAAKLFCDHLINGSNLGSPSQALLQACSSLFQKCMKVNDIDTYVPVVDGLLASFRITQRDLRWQDLGADYVCGVLLETSGYGQNKHKLDPQALRKAVAIFTRATYTSTNVDGQTKALGIRLLAATSKAKLFNDTIELFEFLQNRSEEILAEGARFVVVSEATIGNYRGALHHFHTSFVQSCPSQEVLFEVVDAAFDAALKLGDLEEAEGILRSSSGMALTYELKISTTWLLQLLDMQWHRSANLGATFRMFQRLEHFVDTASHPQALYSTMVGIALKAESGNIADLVAAKLLNGYANGSPDIEVCGHYALWKARNNDWSGVEEEFMTITRQAHKEKRLKLTDIFIPVIKEYSRGHNVSETEAFLFSYIEKFGLLPNRRLSSAMVRIYALAGEMDSIARWISYAKPSGFKVSADEFNGMLHSLHKKWHVKLHPHLLGLCKAAKALDPTLVNQTTARILRGAVPRLTKRDPRRAESLLESINGIIEPPEPASLLDKMSDAVAKGEPELCLQHYREATSRHNGQYVGPQHVAVAVAASLRTNGPGSFDQAMQLAKRAKRQGIDVTPAMTPLLLHKMNEAMDDAAKVEQVVLSTLKSLRDRRLEFPQKAASRCAAILVERGQPRHAIKLWTTLWASGIHTSSAKSMDLVSLTVLLKAYLRVYDGRGIRHVLHIMSQNGLVPDRHVKELVKAYQKECKQEADESPTKRKRREVIDECWQIVREMRAQGRKDGEAAASKLSMILQNAASEHRAGPSSSADNVHR